MRNKLLFLAAFVCFLLFPALSLASDTYDISGIWDVNYVILHVSYHAVITGYMIIDGEVIDIYDEQDYINDELFVEAGFAPGVTQSGDEFTFIFGDTELLSGSGSISDDQVSFELIIPELITSEPGAFISSMAEMIYHFEGTYDPENSTISGEFTSTQEYQHLEMWIYVDGALAQYTFSEFTDNVTSGTFTVKVKRPVLLVHGFPSNSWLTWNNNMIPALEQDDYIIEKSLFTIDLGLLGAGNIKDFGQDICNKLQTIKTKTGATEIDIIAHSMGGLASRWCIQKLGGNKYVGKLIMLGTPNHGSLGFSWMQDISWQVPSPQDVPWEIFQMLPDSDFLAELNYNENHFDSNSWLIKDDPISSGYTVLAGSGFRTAELFCWSAYSEDAFFPKSTYNGDEIVGVRSAKLTSVPCHQYNVKHAELNTNSSVIDDVIHLLNNEPVEHGVVCQPSPRDSNEPSLWQAIQIISYDLISQGTTKTFEVILDYGLPIAKIGVGYPGSELDLTLVTPGGTVIDPAYAGSDPNIDFTYDINSTDNLGNSYDEKYYTISNPEPGTWTVEVAAVNVPPEGEKFSVGAMLNSNMMLLSRTRDNIYSLLPGEPLILEAFLWDGDLLNYLGTEVEGTIEKPDATKEIITFRDDGTNGDSIAGDGVFTYNYTDTMANGMYYADINANTDSFARQTQLIFSINMLLDGADFADYAVFADRWMDQSCTHASWCNGADLNNSGEVDIYDLDILVEYWPAGIAN